jgi:hypothetical protein
VTFENIQGLQRQNKKLLAVLRSLTVENDEKEVQLIKDLKVNKYRQVIIVFDLKLKYCTKF